MTAVATASTASSSDTERLRASVQRKLRRLQREGVGGNAPSYLLTQSYTAARDKLVKMDEAAEASLRRCGAGDVQ